MFRHIIITVVILTSLISFCLTAAVAQQTGELKLDLEKFPEQEAPQSEGGELKLDLEQFESEQDGGDLKLDLDKFDASDNSTLKQSSDSGHSSNAPESQLDLEKFHQNSSSTSTSAPPVRQRSFFSGTGFYLFLGAAVLLFLIFILRRRR